MGIIWSVKHSIRSVIVKVKTVILSYELFFGKLSRKINPITIKGGIIIKVSHSLFTLPKKMDIKNPSKYIA